MLEVRDLPALNAALNLTSAILLGTGYYFIRKRNIPAHRACMVAALFMSTAFLTSYLIYHANVGSRPFQGQGVVRVAYFTILITHVVLAATILPLALTTTARGLMAQYDRHVRIARWTLPVWLYVSVTGVLVYVVLYHMNPPAA